MKVLAVVLTGTTLSLCALDANAQPTPVPPVAPAPVPAKVEPKPAEAATGPLDVPETPPPPPKPGDGPLAPKAPAGPPKSFQDERPAQVRGGVQNAEPIAGWHGMLFLRDADDNFRISPSAMLQLDLNTFVGPGVDSVSRAQGGAGLTPQIFVRRLRLGFNGEFLKRWSFNAAIDFAQDVGNVDGSEETSAGKPGVDPTAETARYRTPQFASTRPSLADVSINYSLCPCLNFQFGQFQPPITMEQRTSDWALNFLDRNVVVRGFVVPAGRETGVMVWGDIGEKVFSYEVMAAGGDGANRPQVDGAFDFMGRFLVRPFGSVKLIKNAHIGVSARHGERDPDGVGYSYASVTTTQGFELFKPSYNDSNKRVVRMIPSGGQNVIGGEVRMPIGPVDIKSEVYYADNHTREAIDGFQLTNTERLGSIRGYGFYGSVTWWALGDEFISGDPGYSRPSKLNLRKKPEILRGLEVDGLVGAIIANYDANDRGGVDDANTPGSATGPSGDLNVWQFGLSASYWHSRWVRMMATGTVYYTPDSGTGENLAVVPGNTVAEADPSAHILGEVGARVQLWF